MDPRLVISISEVGSKMDRKEGMDHLINIIDMVLSLFNVDPRFAKHLGEFIAGSLAPENLEAKQIAGKAVKSHEMVDFFQRYLEIFNGDEIPEPKSIFNTTAEVTNLHALNSSREAYVERMEGLKLSATSDAIIDTDLAKRHQENLSHSLQLFQVVHFHRIWLTPSCCGNIIPQEQSKFGGAEFAAQYQEALLKEIQEKFDYFQKLNDSKIQNLFYQAKEGYVFLKHMFSLAL